MSIDWDSLSDEQVVCAWMEPDGYLYPFIGDIATHPYSWWTWFTRIENRFLRHTPIHLDLDHIHAVEKRLPEYMLSMYERELGNIINPPSRSRKKDPPCSRRLWHAPASARIAALAIVIKEIVKG